MPADRDNLGFLLAKASQRWNELLHQRFVAAGFPEVRPAYGSVPKHGWLSGVRGVARVYTYKAAPLLVCRAHQPESPLTA